MELISIPADRDGLSRAFRCRGVATVMRFPLFKGGRSQKHYCYDNGRPVPRHYSAPRLHLLICATRH